jgi:hypothetical protein
MFECVKFRSETSGGEMLPCLLYWLNVWCLWMALDVARVRCFERGTVLHSKARLYALAYSAFPVFLIVGNAVKLGLCV